MRTYIHCISIFYLLLRQTVRHPELTYPAYRLQSPGPLTTSWQRSSCRSSPTICRSRMRAKCGSNRSAKTKMHPVQTQRSWYVLSKQRDKSQRLTPTKLRTNHTWSWNMHKLVKACAIEPAHLVMDPKLRHTAGIRRARKKQTQKPQCTPDSPRCQGPPPQASLGDTYIYIYIHINTHIYT